MTTPKELYKILSADFKAEEHFHFANRGEGMMHGREPHTSRVFLVNTNLKEAWELVTADEKIALWSASIVDKPSLQGLPPEALRNAEELNVPYYFGVNEFRDGVASVSWMLQPDSCCHADEQGFGMDDDEEINLCAFVDTRANIVIPFQVKSWEEIEALRPEAARIAKELNSKN